MNAELVENYKTRITLSNGIVMEMPTLTSEIFKGVYSELQDAIPHEGYYAQADIIDIPTGRITHTITAYDFGLGNCVFTITSNRNQATIFKGSKSTRKEK